jgi:hypothetical chaperone protein
VLIVDIGGGTSDFSIVRVGPRRWLRPDRNDDVLATHGQRVGGTDLDRLLSLSAVMPHLGYNTTTGAGRATMPRHYYLDLATWHRINTLYTQRIAADLKALRAEADAPEKLDRLIRVIHGRHGHGLAMAVEAAKIALSDAEAARLQLSTMTGGPNPVVTRASFDEVIATPLDRITTAISTILADAGLKPPHLSTVFLTGGSANLPALRGLIAALLPGIPLATGDMLGSVGTGLALDAASRFA